MRDEVNHNGPAFPCEWDYIGSNREAANGMTLRDYFAAEAFPTAVKVHDKGHVDGWLGVARTAYDIADAMLKARQS